MQAYMLCILCVSILGLHNFKSRIEVVYLTDFSVSTGKYFRLIVQKVSSMCVFDHKSYGKYDKNFDRSTIRRSKQMKYITQYNVMLPHTYTHIINNIYNMSLSGTMLIAITTVITTIAVMISQ